MSKNPEVFRLWVALSLVLLLFILIALATSMYMAYQGQQDVLEYQAAIIGSLVEKYPEAELGMIQQSLQVEQEVRARGKEILRSYGIESTQLLFDVEQNRRNIQLYLILTLSLLLLLALCFFLLMYRFIHNKYGQIDKMNSYTEQIAQGNYSLDIRDNAEGEISLLKNKIYKITTMLREQSEALEQDKVLLADSLADISHQLKTPLTSLSVVHEILQQNPTQEVKEQFLDRMRAQLQRMEWLISSLLTISKLDAGTLSLKQESVNVYALVQKALETLHIPIDIKMLHIKVEGDKQAQFRGDFNWSCEALINLLKNGVEHTPEQGSLHVHFEENTLHTKIYISDQGEGIVAEDLPYIFQRFYRGKNARDDSVGIGLAMSQAIIQKQNGDITVSSKKGEGTQFVITFYKNVF